MRTAIGMRADWIKLAIIGDLEYKIKTESD